MSPRSTEGEGRLTLGIDPGSRFTGYGLVISQDNRLSALEYGVLRAGGSALALEERLRSLFERLDALLARTAPDVMAVEGLFTHRNMRSAIQLAQARGIVLLAAARHSVEVRQYAPRSVKMAVTGYGSAEKSQVQSMVCALLGLRPREVPLDASDALAVALCEAQSAPLRRALKGSGDGPSDPGSR